jgi:hypothetical protein
MALHRMDDVSAAAWLTGRQVDPARLVTLGPAGFAAYARLRYIPDPDGPGRSESDSELPDDHPTDLAQARTVLTTLSEHTDTAGHCFFCVWDGWVGTSLDPELVRGPLVDLPHRRYVLFAGALEEIGQWEQTFGGGEPCPPPAFVWPADHRWCFTSDVDPHWAGIGASAKAVAALIARADVDVVAQSPDHRPPAYAG